MNPVAIEITKKNFETKVEDILRLCDVGLFNLNELFCFSSRDIVARFGLGIPSDQCDWVDRKMKNDDFNPGQVTASAIEVWLAKDISGQHWGLLKKLRLLALLFTTQGKCFYTGTELDFSKDAKKHERAEIDHLFAHLRTTYDTGIDLVGLSPVVICSGQANSRRSHTPVVIWLRTIREVMDHEKEIRSFFENNASRHQLQKPKPNKDLSTGPIT